MSKVDDPGDIYCDDEASQRGRPGEYPDTWGPPRALSASLCDCDAFEVLESAVRISHLRFHVYHENGKICAHRTDHEDPWGLHLARIPAWPSMAQHGPAWPSMAQHGPVSRPWELLSCSRRVADVALRSCTVTTRTGYDQVLILRDMRDAVICNERLTAYCDASNGHSCAASS